MAPAAFMPLVFYQVVRPRNCLLYSPIRLRLWRLSRAWSTIWARFRPFRNRPNHVLHSTSECRFKPRTRQLRSHTTATGSTHCPRNLAQCSFISRVPQVQPVSCWRYTSILRFDWIAWWRIMCFEPQFPRRRHSTCRCGQEHWRYRGPPTIPRSGKALSPSRLPH